LLGYSCGPRLLSNRMVGNSEFVQRRTSGWISAPVYRPCGRRQYRTVQYRVSGSAGSADCSGDRCQPGQPCSAVQWSTVGMVRPALLLSTALLQLTAGFQLAGSPKLTVPGLHRLAARVAAAKREQLAVVGRGLGSLARAETRAHRGIRQLIKVKNKKMSELTSRLGRSLPFDGVNMVMKLGRGGLQYSEIFMPVITSLMRNQAPHSLSFYKNYESYKP